jgi:hypothetical protein
MKRVALEVGLIGLMFIATLNAIACAPVDRAHAGEAALPLSPAPEMRGDSCLAPALEATRQRCAEWEREALASTVRLEIRVSSLDAAGVPVAQVDGSSGHAAVKDGRYLVTHNHYAVSMTTESPGTISRLTVLKSNGEVILSDTPLSAFRVLVQDSQTQILDFGAVGGVGLFAARGIASAAFSQRLDSALLPGVEVAQIDWDGQTTHVDWVRVAAVVTKGETPYLELDNFVERGASGGGVYLNGIHIGNNWSRSRDRSADTGEVLREYSVVALNPPGA